MNKFDDAFILHRLHKDEHIYPVWFKVNGVWYRQSTLEEYK